MLLQLVSIFGAVLVLGSYAAHQLDRLAAGTLTYQLMNLFGGSFLLLAALDSRQLGLILIEAAWTVISAVGLWRLRRSPAAE